MEKADAPQADVTKLCVRAHNLQSRTLKNNRECTALVKARLQVGERRAEPHNQRQLSRETHGFVKSFKTENRHFVVKSSHCNHSSPAHEQVWDIHGKDYTCSAYNFSSEKTKFHQVPTIQGTTYLEATKWMVSIEGKVAYILDEDLGFADALSVLMASFYAFNVEYQEPACATLEFIQRFFLRINPEDGSKCTTRTGVSRKTGQLVKRKSATMNPRVLSFLCHLTEFEWKNME
ncbi:uncharacterized protein [Nothobranchius furzeri]|uniref:uncharacterized protein n=1 Tax=Nothobranchius furzeri TaxID=105023 RepID=UPI003904B6FE